MAARSRAARGSLRRSSRSRWGWLGMGGWGVGLGMGRAPAQELGARLRVRPLAAIGRHQPRALTPRPLGPPHCVLPSPHKRRASSARRGTPSSSGCPSATRCARRCGWGTRARRARCASSSLCRSRGALPLGGRRGARAAHGLRPALTNAAVPDTTLTRPPPANNRPPTPPAPQVAVDQAARAGGGARLGGAGPVGRGEGQGAGTGRGGRVLEAGGGAAG
jgi:hypothetical protein